MLAMVVSCGGVDGIAILCGVGVVVVRVVIVVVVRVVIAVIF